jgi:hypothetical protein
MELLGDEYILTNRALVRRLIQLADKRPPAAMSRINTTLRVHAGGGGDLPPLP